MVIRTVSFTDIWCTEFDVFQANDDFLVSNVEFNVAAKVIDDLFVSSDTDVTNDFLHSRELVDCRWDTVVV